jgi:DNA-binding beta-propeller fold protein YncE
MGLNYGHMYKFDDTSGKATIKSVTDLGGSPEASTVDSGDNVVVATPDRVLRVDKDGKTNAMYKSGEHLTYPTSVAVDPNGVVYVAMRFFVLRLIPQKASGYNAEWLMPEQCRVFKLEKYVCGCEAK